MDTESTYTAILDSGAEQESIRLEMIDGSPQRSFTRLADIDGEEVEVVWELEPDDDGFHVYRPVRVEGRDDGSGLVSDDRLTDGGGADAASGD
ncbi:hypothetical protein C5C69_02305 [Rathayibacter sp. AY1C7]|uniref:hypothetical protein n=1 Tax=unclassified Rathayibacter TaxID=2609250 RepID=UPI000CE83CB7|nr:MULTISPECIES: hypothetical protein [unclassified Rathayibacter]PPG63191.1 hypothetical protein C5C69_02305 [Rathayibacter sp. AY1C7]PPH51339.1 hypothetical protein C5C67_11620 [Rathayibacter sp. AY1E1]